MLRRIASGRGAVLTVVAMAAVTVLLWLGQWQWDRSRPDVLVAGLATVDIGEVIPGSGRLVTRDQGRRVSVSGIWRPDRQVMVADRRRPGGDENGRWIVTAIEIGTGFGTQVGPDDGGSDDTRLIPVVRGWVADSGTVDVVRPPPAPTGTAKVEGWIQASEALDVTVDVVQPGGVVSLLAGADLVNRWPETVVDGFVIADAGAQDAGLLPGVDSPLPGPVESARAGRDWRNVAYAGQWWVFAVFAAVLWWRALADSAPRPAGSVRAGRHDEEGGA